MVGESSVVNAQGLRFGGRRGCLVDLVVFVILH